ncbi:hypothetical protein [Kordiimonas pumila]|uniref:Uncharacterized protein n=1 Tax=Kordiimonas pumila TaxID=2161677 RepID=A0ABV7D3J0_9PROT|nr:hypothetical protein [Kordiimonas pumila]
MNIVTVISQIQDTFNNREIAIAIWILILLGWALTKRDVAESVFSFLQSLFEPAIITTIMLATAYILCVILVLRKVGYWDITLLKMTLMWSLTALGVLFSKIQPLAQKRGAFRGAIIENFKIITIVEFITHLYAFSLITELILVPVTVILAMLQAYNHAKDQSKSLDKLLSFIFTAFGIFLFYNALSNIWNNTDQFFTKNTANEFTIPLVLSTAFLPFVYTASLYLKYDSLMCQYKRYLPDDTEYTKAALHYIFWQALISFRGNKEAFKLLNTNLTVDAASSIKGITKEIREIKKLLQAEKNSSPIDIEDGWSPYQARRYLDECGFETDYYHAVMDGEFGWCSGSNTVYIENSGYPKSTLYYYVSGTEFLVTSLKLSLYIKNIETEVEAKERYLALSSILFLQAFMKEIPLKALKGIKAGKPFKTYMQGKVIELQKESLPFIDRDDYALHLYIRNPDAEHYH